MTMFAYPLSSSVDAGSRAVFALASSAQRIRIELVNSTGGSPIARDLVVHHGLGADVASPQTWPCYQLSIPRDAPSGAYIASFIDEDTGAGSEHAADARSARALLVVRGREPRSILVNLPLFTYHAYNVAHVDGTLGESEGDCLYSGPRSVSLHRPGGGVGGHTWDAVNPDIYDRSSPRQTFAHWDAPALNWLAAHDIDVDVSTDLDLHQGVYPLAHHDVILAFGHQEYWTDAIRSRLDDHVERGGMLALFSGNTGWFRVTYDAIAATLTRAGRWDDFKDPIGSLSYARGGGKWRGARPPTGFRIGNAAHWLFAGSGASDGTVFGERDRIVGYECDGALPGDAGVVASASLAGWDVADGSGEVNAGANAAVAVREGRGTIVHAGTTDWPRLLGNDAIVDRVTLNVVQRLSSPRYRHRLARG